MRIGVVRRPGWPPSILAVFDAAIEDLRRLGAIIKDPVELPHAKDIGDPEDEVLTYELLADMAAYLATRTGQPLRTLADLVRFNTAHAREEMPWFGQEFFEKALQKGDLTTPAYTTALATCQRLSRAEGIDAALATNGLDVLLAPTGGLPWVSDLLAGDNFTGSSSTPPAVAGYPSLLIAVQRRCTSCRWECFFFTERMRRSWCCCGWRTPTSRRPSTARRLLSGDDWRRLRSPKSVNAILVL